MLIMMNFLYGILLCFFVSAVAETTSTASVHQVEENLIPNGKRCDHQWQCKSKYCEKPYIHFSFGKCQNKIADGKEPYRGRSSSCQSGAKVCNVCGHKMNYYGKCNFDSDCKSGNCKKSWWNGHCGGKCKSRGEEGESDEDNFLEISDDQETGKHLRAA